MFALQPNTTFLLCIKAFSHINAVNSGGYIAKTMSGNRSCPERQLGVHTTTNPAFQLSSISAPLGTGRLFTLRNWKIGEHLSLSYTGPEGVICLHGQ